MIIIHFQRHYQQWLKQAWVSAQSLLTWWMAIHLVQQDAAQADN